MVRKLHKIHCSRFLCTLSTVTVENSIVLPLRTKIALQKGLGSTCLFWLLVWGIPILNTNNDIFRAVLPIENVRGSVVWPYQISFKNLCAPSNPIQPPCGFFVHYIWSLPGFVTISHYPYQAETQQGLKFLYVISLQGLTWSQNLVLTANYTISSKIYYYH